MSEVKMDPVIKQYIDEADMEMIQKISSELMNIQTKILDHVSVSLETNRQLMVKYFENVKDDIDGKIKISSTVVETVAEKKIHDIVNGSLTRINAKLDNITCWQQNHDELEINQSQEMKDLIDKVYNKTLYGTMQNNLDKHPLKTGLFFFLLVGVIVSIIYQVFDANAMDLIEYIAKLF